MRNFGDQDFGRIDLTTATANSVNTVYVALAKEVGPKKVEQMAHRAGIGDDVRLADENGDPALGIALGIYGVPVIDQANAFATFAAAGQAAEPFMVKSVKDVGQDEIVYSAKVVVEEAFSADVAADATYAMQQVVERGSARRNGRLDGGRPAAGKTGTTQESNDAWMVGFTPQLSAAVWVGRGNNKPIVGELGSSGGLTGGSAPARIWKSFMDAALAGQPEEEFPPRAVRRPQPLGRLRRRRRAPARRRPSPPPAPRARAGGHGVRAADAGAGGPRESRGRPRLPRPASRRRRRRRSPRRSRSSPAPAEPPAEPPPPADPAPGPTA